MIKKNWDDLTIGDHLMIQDISNMQMASEDEKNMRVAALLSGLEYEQLLQMPFENLRAIMDNTEFLLHKPEAKKARRKYEIDGRTYMLFRDPSEMTVAQFIDFQQIYRDGFEKYPAEMLAIFLVPEGHHYNDGYDKEEQMEDMRKMSVTEALGVCGFFIRRCHRLVYRMMTYSMLMIKWRRLVAPKAMKPVLKEMERTLAMMAEESERQFGLTLSTP